MFNERLNRQLDSIRVSVMSRYRGLVANRLSFGHPDVNLDPHVVAWFAGPESTGQLCGGNSTTVFRSDHTACQ